MEIWDVDSPYWKFMDVCIDVEEGLIDHVTATNRIMLIISQDKEKETV